MARGEKVYSSLFGSQASKGQLYGGFYTLFGGIIVGLAAIVLLYVAPATEGQYDWRKVSFTLAALAGALVFLGIAWTLPSKKGLRAIGTVGFVLCLGATAAFWVAYPLHFNVPDSQGDYTEAIIGVYVVGVALVLTGTFTSLVGYYLDRVQAAAAGSARGGPGGSDFYDEYEVPDSVIEKDIEYAMKKYKYAWGEGQTGSTGIQINIKDEFEAGTIVGGGKGVARTVTLEAPQVDDATKALRGIRPGAKEKTMATSEVDAQTNALLAFRKQKMEMQAQKAAHRKLGWWTRMLMWLGLRKPPSTAAPVATQKVGK